jgi:hypothetical protein
MKFRKIPAFRPCLTIQDIGLPALARSLCLPSNILESFRKVSHATRTLIPTIFLSPPVRRRADLASPPVQQN